MNIEELAKKFITLGKKSALTKLEHAEAKNLMVELKKAGMSNLEISKLSGDKWSSSTIKGYTTAIKSSEPSPWQEAISVLDALIFSGRSLEDVDTALAIDKDLKSNDIELDDVVEFFLVADSASMDVAAVTQQVKQLNESGLSIIKVVEALEFKKALEETDFSLDSLPALASLAQKYDDPTKVLEALDAYTSLNEILAQSAIAKKKLGSLNETLVGIREQVEAAEATLSQLKEPVASLDKAEQLGFGVNEFEKVAGLVQKYGSTNKLLDAIGAYETLSDIQVEMNNAKANLTSLKEDTQKLQLKHSHIQTAISICEKLTTQYEFGLDAVSAILSAAERYGDPITVLRAIEAYGKLEVVLQEIDKQQGIMSSNKKEIVQLEGMREDILKELKALSDLALEVGSEVGKVQGQMSASDVLKKLMMLINEPYSAEYGDHINTAILVALSLRRWVIKNETKFKNVTHIASGLEYLIKEMGGLP